jgi:hypothetical protein
MMSEKCSQCGKTGTMPIYDCGRNFCSSACQELYTYRPQMTDETFAPETIIDEIELDGGKEFIYLKTPEDFYSLVSHCKVVMTRVRAFYRKQLHGYYTVKEAQEAWVRFKKHYGYKSRVDILKEKQAGKTVELPKNQQAKPPFQVKISINLTSEQKTKRIAELDELVKRYSSDIVSLADRLEDCCDEPTQKRAVMADYRDTSRALIEAKTELRQLRGIIA